MSGATFMHIAYGVAAAAYLLYAYSLWSRRRSLRSWTGSE